MSNKTRLKEVKMQVKNVTESNWPLKKNPRTRTNMGVFKTYITYKEQNRHKYKLETATGVRFVTKQVKDTKAQDAKGK